MIAFIEAQGSLLKMTVRGFKSSRKVTPHRRGIIRAFSPASRRRLMRFMARLKVRKIRATFITLTFSNEVNNVEAKRAFKQFSMRLRRAFPTASVVWRLERQKRGAIHFHLLCFNLPFWPQAELQKTWEDCTNEDKSIVDIRLVHGARSVMAYVSKYIAKVSEDAEKTSLDDGSYQHKALDDVSGRYWGYINKELLPVGELVTGVLTERQTIRSLSSFVWSLLKNDNPYNSLSFHLFCDNARWLCERAVEEGGCWLDEWEYTVKDHSTPKPTYNPYTERFSEQELRLISVPTIGRLYRPNEVSLSQPVSKGWVARSSKAVLAQRVPPYFDNRGIVVNSDHYTQELDHAIV